MTLGLDLQGGLEVVKKAVPEKGETVDEEGMDDAVSIIRSRIDSVGAFEPEIRKQGSDQIVIELPGVRDQHQATELIGQTAKLELFDLQGDLIPGASLDTNGNPIAHDNLFDLLVSQQGAAKNGEPSAFYLLKETKKGKQTEHKLVVGPKPTREAILASAVREEEPSEGGGAAGGHEDLRGPGEDGRRHLRQGCAVLPGRRPGPAGPHVLLPLQVRPGATRRTPSPRCPGTT